LTGYLKNLYLERKGQPNAQTDMLGVLLAAKEDPNSHEVVRNLTDDHIADNLVVMWFGSYDTTSKSLIWTIKYLNDCPEVAKKVKVRGLVNLDFCSTSAHSS
jgi:cytochrome P450